MSDHVYKKIELVGSSKTSVEDAIPIPLQTAPEKARLTSFELLAHLKAETLDNKNSEAHYQTLIQNISGVNNSLIEITATLSLDSSSILPPC